MKVKKDLVVVALATFCIASTLFITRPILSNPGIGDYNPWADINDDGTVDIFDAITLSNAYSTQGTPLAKASIEYDSGWINITDKRGQCITILDLNCTDAVLEITGRTTLDSETLRYLGLKPVGEWNNTYGGSSYDAAYSMIQTSDEGYALAGVTFSYGIGGDVWLVKTDMSGNAEWNRTYGGDRDDVAESIVPAEDGGYVLGGYTRSFGSLKAWLIKTDSSGNVQWNKTIQVLGDTSAHTMVKTNDGGYALGGDTWSGADNWDFWLAKVDAEGNMQWNRTYGGTSLDSLQYLSQTSDNGYALAGVTSSFGGGSADFWLIKTDSDGNPQWNWTYGGEGYDRGNCVVNTRDGGYAVVGQTDSFAGYDSLLVKVDSMGNMQWNETYAGLNAWRVIQTADSGFALAGSSLIKTDTEGNILWSMTLGWETYSVLQTSCFAYAVAGGRGEMWLAKIDLENGLTWTDSTANTVTLYRGLADEYWNHVRVRIWKPKG